MKAVILAGGYGTRISEESQIRPKPMIEIGGRPILWHIMKIYSHYGINDFIICCGYKGYLIKEYFANYFLHMSDVTIDMTNNNMDVHQRNAEPWKVSLIDTGEKTMTGGRIKKIKDYVKEDEFFCLTYGDGLTDLNVSKLIETHQKSGLNATVSAVYPPGRFGSLKIDGNRVIGFKEKPQGDGNMINGGFFILSPKIFDLIDDENSVWEREPMEKLAKLKQLSVFMHDGFWQPMDTLRDKIYLESLWDSGHAPWKIWE